MAGGGSCSGQEKTTCRLSFHDLSIREVDPFADVCAGLGDFVFPEFLHRPGHDDQRATATENVLISRVALCRIRNLRVAPSDSDPITLPISRSSSACHPTLSEPER